MPAKQKIYHVSGEGLIAHVKDVYGPDAAKKLIKEIKRREQKYRIKEDYQQRMKQSSMNSDTIIEQMAIGYFGDVSFYHRIKNAIYHSDAAYFNNDYG